MCRNWSVQEEYCYWGALATNYTSKISVYWHWWVSSQYLHALQLDNACSMRACSIPRLNLWVHGRPTPAPEQSCQTNVSYRYQLFMPAIWLHFVHEIVVLFSQSPQHSWWGLVLADISPEQLLTLHNIQACLFYSGKCGSLIFHACTAEQESQLFM